MCDFIDRSTGALERSPDGKILCMRDAKIGTIDHVNIVAVAVPVQVNPALLGDAPFARFAYRRQQDGRGRLEGRSPARLPADDTYRHRRSPLRRLVPRVLRSLSLSSPT